MPRSVMCRMGLHRWDRIRDERALEFLTCRRCGNDRARGWEALARAWRARATVLLSTSLVLVGALMASWLVVGRR